MREKFAERMKQVKPSVMGEMMRNASNREVISFGGGFPDPALFPLKEFQEIFSRVLEVHGRQALQYSSGDGLPALRDKLAARMKDAGFETGREGLLITQGAQQGMDLAAKLLLDPGDGVVVEKPTFLGALMAFDPYQPRYACVEMDGGGMVMESLEEALKTTPRVKFIYIVPEFQNPTGVSLGLERRRRLAELAREHDVMVLEDSPYRDLRYEGEPLPAIKSFDTDGRVIHLGSFSKILAPGLRLGWLAASPELIERLRELKLAADTHCSTANMYAVNEFLERCDLAAHIARLRRAYRAKKDLMLRTIAETFPPAVERTDPEGGLFTWLTFPRGGDAARMMRERILPEAKVTYAPGDGFFAADPEPNHCRINYSFLNDEQIVRGASQMGRILHDYFA